VSSTSTGRPTTTDVVRQVTRVLDEVLSLGGRSAAYTRDTVLLGAVPQLDSMAVVSLITTIEERFNIVIPDDEINGDTLASVGSLADYVAAKLG
jgi:acyl carrier protein